MHQFPYRDDRTRVSYMSVRDDGNDVHELWLQTSCPEPVVLVSGSIEAVHAMARALLENRHLTFMLHNERGPVCSDEILGVWHSLHGLDVDDPRRTRLRTAA